MSKDEALKFYEGNQSALARALGLDQSTVNKWAAIPPLRQLQLERVTGGRLKADPDAFARKPARRKVAA